MYNLASSRVNFPIFPLLIFLLSIFINGVTKLEELVKKTSSQLYKNDFFIRFSINFKLFLYINFLIASLVTPFKISELAGWVIKVSFLITHILEDVPSVTYTF